MSLSSTDIGNIIAELESEQANSGQNTSALGDIATDVKRGVQALPGIATGILDILPGAAFNVAPFDAATDYIGEATGFQPGRFAEEARAELSPARQAADARVAEAEGFLDTFTTTLAEPRALAGLVTESLPAMLAGGAIGKGLQAAGAVTKGATAVGIGEGAVSAGAQFEGLTDPDQGVDPRVAALAATATGAVVGAVGIGGATLAQRMKIADPDLVVAGLGGSAQRGAGFVDGVAVQPASKLARAGGLGKRVGLGAVQEGLLEEAPQSAAEAIIANAALGNSPFEGVGENIASGMLAGSALGGAFNIRNSQTTGEAPPLREEVAEAAEAAGFDLASIGGQSELFKLLNQPGDPVENAKAARKAVTDVFTAHVQNLIDTEGNGIGPKRGPKLQAKLDAGELTSRDAIDNALKGLSVLDIQKPIRATDHYQHLPQTVEEAAEPQAQQQTQPDVDPASPAAAEATAPAPVVPIERTPAQQAADQAQANKYGLDIEDFTDISEADAEAALNGLREARQLVDEATLDEDFDKEVVAKRTRKEKLDAEVAAATSKEAREKGTAKPLAKQANQARARKGVADLISGITTSAEAKSLSKMKLIAKKNASQALTALKQALPQFYNNAGRPKKALPNDLHQYLQALPKALKDSHAGKDGRLAEAMRRKGERLAGKYRTDALRVHVNSLVYGHKLLRNARPVGPVSAAVRTMLNRVGTNDPEVAGYLNGLFAAFHKVASRYEQVSGLAEKEPKLSTDFNPEATDLQVDAGRANAVAKLQGLGGMASQMTELLGLIEEVVGKDELARAQAVAINATSKTRKALPGQKPDEQGGNAVLFNRFYKKFKDEGFVDPGIGVGAIRKTNEAIKKENARLGKATEIVTMRAGEPTSIDGEVAPAIGLKPSEGDRASSQLEVNMQKTRNIIKDKDNSVPPAIVLLRTIGRTSTNAVTRLVAKRLRIVLAASDYANNIVLQMHPEKKSPTGAVGSFIPAANKEAGAILNLWTDGHTEVTIIHELMHAVTVGLTSAHLTGKLTGKAKIAMDGMAGLHKVVLSTMSRQRKNSGKDTLGSETLDRMHDLLSSDIVGLDEFITYSMANRELQGWLQNNRAPKIKFTKEGKFTGKNLWAVFSTKLRTLFNLNDMRRDKFDSMLDVYAESVGAVLSEAEALGSQKLDTFFFKKRGNLVGNRKKLPKSAKVAEFESVADPSKPWTGTTSSAAATEANTKDAASVAKTRSIIDEAAREKSKQEQEDKRKEREFVRGEKAQETTAVPPGKKGRAGPRNLTVVDAVERRIADGVVSFASGGEYTNYEAFANKMLVKYGNKVKDYSAKDGFVAESLGKFLSKTVDSFGVPKAYRNAMASFESAFRGRFNEMYGMYDSLLTLTAEQQQALLDFLVKPNEDTLRARIPDSKLHEPVIHTVAALNDLLQKAKDMGMVNKQDMSKTLGDYITLAEGSFSIVSSVSFKQLSPPSDKNNIVTFAANGDGRASMVSKDNLISKGGKLVVDPGSREFYMAASAGEEGALYAIEVGADTSVWNDFGVAPLEGENADQRPFRVSNPTVYGTDVTFFRKITVAERQAAVKEREGDSIFDNNPKAQAHVMSGLTKLAQEWGRNIQGREIIDGMLDTNEGIAESDKWITATAPTNADGTPIAASRIINIAGKGEVQKSKALQAKLRVPGNWAFIENTPENRTRFGAMAGIGEGDTKTPGMYVAGPVYTSMLDYYDNAPMVNSAVFRTALTLWKKGKTVFSPVAHVNNISGNVVLAYYYDLPPENIFTAYRIVVWGLHSEKWRASHPNYLSKEEHALRIEMDDKGIRLAQAKNADFDVAAEAGFSDWIEKKAKGIRGLTTLFSHIEKASGKASDLYSNQDNVFRLATYMTHIQDNAAMGTDGIVGADAKDAAALAAERAFVDYRIHAPWIKGARETVLPFIAWPYRMFPLLMKIMITKPWKAANTMGAITALNSLAYAALGADGDAEEEERSLMPEWHQQGISWMPWVPSSIRLPFGSGDNAYFWNISRAITLADMDQLGGSGVPSIIMPGGPAMILAYAAAGYDPFTGKELSNGTEDTMGFLQSRAEYLARGLAPGAVTTITAAIKHQGEVGPLGYDHNFWVDAAKVLGISSFQVNKPEAAFYKDIARKQATREFSSEIGRMWRNELRQKSVDYEAGVQAEIELQQRLTLRLQELAGV